MAANPTALHPDDVVAALGPNPDRARLARLRAAIAAEPGADWERDLLDALAVDDDDARIALVNEQLTELDYRMQKWARVPRVCASVATSVGILLGTLVLRRGLAANSEMESEAFEGFVRDLLNDAVSVVAFGIVGTAFSIAVHSHARRVARVRLEATDKMIEKMENAAGHAGA